MMMETNFEYSQSLYHWAVDRIYASSASVYGNSIIYAYSKKLFDDYVRRNHKTGMSPFTGLRYFNVYGQREAHKGPMASVAFNLYNQISAAKP